MKFTARLNGWVAGSGLQRLQERAPNLAQHWKAARMEDGHVPDAQQDHAQWQDDVATTLLAVSLMLGLSLSIFLIPFSATINPLLILAYLMPSQFSGLLLAQALTLLGAAAIWRWLSWHPWVMYLAATALLIAWLDAMRGIVPGLYLLFTVPFFAIMLGALAFKEIARALRIRGALPVGSMLALSLLVALCILLWATGYFANLMGFADQAFQATQDFDSRRLRNRASSYLFAGVLIFIATAVFLLRQRLWMAWQADENNRPSDCVAVTLLTLLSDLASFGLLFLLSPSSDKKHLPPLDAPNPNDLQNGGHASAAQRPEPRTPVIGEALSNWETKGKNNRQTN